MADAPQIDLNKIKEQAQAAVAGMTKEQLLAEFHKIRVRQKTQQKKQQGKGAQKEYMKRKNEQGKLIKAKLAELGLLEEVEAKADAEAEEKFQEYLRQQVEEAGAESETEEEEQNA